MTTAYGWTLGTLKGINAPIGTVIGYSERHQRFLAVADNLFLKETSVRFATQAEVNQIGTIEPRSIAEHAGIPKRVTPYGHARLWGPRPYVKPVLVSSIASRKEGEAIKRTRRSVNRYLNSAYELRGQVIGKTQNRKSKDQ